jgi:hypothetical protein
MEFRHRKAERGLKAYYAEGRAIIFEHLLVDMMWRMVGSYRINRTVSYRLDKREPVFLRTQRRVHLGIRVEPDHGLIGQRKVMRRHFAGYPETSSASLPDHLDGPGGRNVRYMYARAGYLSEHYVTRDVAFFGSAVYPLQTEKSRIPAFIHHSPGRKACVLAMIDNDKAVIARILHRVSHNLGIHHGISIIGDRDRAGLFHLGHLRKLYARRRARDCAHGKYSCQPRLVRFLYNVAGHGGVIVYGIRIRHRANGGKPARDRRGRSRCDCLFILLAGLAQVDVEIDKSRSHYESSGVEYFRALRLDSFSDRCYAPVNDEQVRNLVVPLRWIEDPASFDKQFH